LEPLITGDFTETTDPFALFRVWMADASASEPNDPNAMTLATVDADGLPNARIVLLKGLDERGFCFFTNTRSAKGQELDGAGKAAIVFHWKSLRRQVRARGLISRVSDAEADAYYLSRPWGSRIGAWASDQSRPLASREDLVARVADVEKRYPEGSELPRPPHWTGYRLTPLAIEFWHDRPFRLHDRVTFTRPDETTSWSRQRLFP